MRNSVKIYDISGRLVSEGFANYELDKLNAYPSQIFIIKEFSEENALLSIVKYFNGSQD
jgi:hypothetical protein